MAKNVTDARGGGIDPTLIENGIVAKNGTKTISGLTGSKYILSANLNFTDTSQCRNHVFYIENDTFTQIARGTGNSFDASTKSGSTLTLRNSNASNTCSYSLIQLE